MQFFLFERAVTLTVPRSMIFILINKFALIILHADEIIRGCTITSLLYNSFAVFLLIYTKLDPYVRACWFLRLHKLVSDIFKYIDYFDIFRFVKTYPDP